MTPPRPEAPDPWRDAVAARLPSGHLAALAPLRDDPGVRVFQNGTECWVRWPSGRGAVVRCLLAVPGVQFYALRGSDWVRLGSRLPTSAGPPAGDGSSLDGLLTPAPFQPMPPPRTISARWPLRLVHGGGPHPVTALGCEVRQLARWADTATTAELAAVRAARCGTRAVLLGPKVPAVPGSVRYWGDGLLLPVGFRTEPELPAGTVRGVLAAADDELVLIDENGAEIIPQTAFEPLTRAGLRLACRQPPAEGEGR